MFLVEHPDKPETSRMEGNLDPTVYVVMAVGSLT